MQAQDKRRWLWAVAAVIGAAVVVRAVLPLWVARELNRRLDTIGQYHGQLDSVDLQLWRGAYTIHALNIVKRGGDVPVPLLDAPRIDLSVDWRSLLHGRVVAEVDFWRAELNLVDGRSDSDTQSGRGVDWRDQLEALLPMQLDELRIHDGTLHFRNFKSNPPVDLTASAVDATVSNLSNVRDAQGQRVATLDASAQVLGQAPLEAHARFDPLGSFEDFSFELRVLDIELTRANSFLQAYAQIDAASGHGDFVMELEATEGKLSGYAKPLLQDVEIFNWKQDIEQQGDNPLRALWEAVAGGVETLLKNQREDQFATRVPISGRIDRPQTGTWDAIVAVLRNAFVEAFKPQFEQLPDR